MNSAWKPISRNNCDELQSQQWQSTVAGNQTEAPEKMTMFALQRTFLKDESLSKFTNELLTRRENFAASIKDDLNSNIYKLNKCCSEEIELLTSRLLEFLRDIKTKVEESKCYDDIIPQWRTNWDENIDEWNCDVRSLLSTLRENVILELRRAESAFIDSRKFTPALIDGFLNDQVTKLNHLMIVNEKMYTDTERHLKLLFDTLLQGWLISYSHQEIVINEYEELIETYEATVHEIDTHRETFKVMDQILAGLDKEEPEFSSVTALKLHLNYLRMCQQHVKLHLKEALLYLRNHLEKQKEYITEEPDRSWMEELWMEIVTILKEQNDEFKNYSKQSAFAWNQFVKRLHCAENSVVRAIERLRTSKFSKILAAEQKMNSLLDQLRESNSVKSMEHIYDRILIELENAELAYVSVRDEEDGILKQFITAIFAASDIFGLQLLLLIGSNPNSGPEVFCVEQNLDETKEISDLDFLRMKYCVFSAQTWIQGLKETLTLLKVELPKFLKTLAVNLMNVYKGESEYWLMLQLEKLTKRKQRIRKNILEIRASELKVHDTALNHLYHVIEQQQKKAKADLKKIKSELSDSDTAVIDYLDQTKTNKLEDTVEKKLKNLADESLIEKHELVRQHTIKKHKYEMERVCKWLSDYCSTYLQSLRLFHEGGNYSYEECEANYKKIFKTIKNLAAQKERDLKRLDRMLSATRDAFNKKLSKIVYPDPTEDELLKAAEREAKDRLKICFNRLKEMITTETYRAAINLKSLKERIGEATRANDFRNWHEAISDVELSCPYFGLSSTFPNLELFTVLQKVRKLALNDSLSQVSRDGSIGTSFSRKFSMESFKSGKRRKSGFKKIRRTLSGGTTASGHGLSEDLFQFNANLEDYENYLTNTKTLINDTHFKVRPILDEAYSKYRVSKDHYEQQRLAAIFSLKHYNLQCESVWTFLFKDYLHLFDSVYTNTMSYIELIKKRFMYDSYNNAMKLKTTHKANLAKLNVEGVKESIDNKLKPWHGYPLNKPLLQQLLKHVVDHCKGQLTSRKEENETYRDELKTLVTENKLKAVHVSEDAKFLYIELFTNPVLNSFLDAIWSYCAKSTDFEETDIEMAQLRKTISSFCSRFRKVTNMNTNLSNQDKCDYILFTFLDGHIFWNFVPNTKQILKAVKNIQEKTRRIPSQSHEYRRKYSKVQYELQTMEGEMLEEEEESQIILTMALHSSYPPTIVRLPGVMYSCNQNGLIDRPRTDSNSAEVFIPLWREFKDEIDTHVQEFEVTAIKNLMVAKKDFDRVAWDLTRWKNEWISNIKEVNRLYLINPILDHPPHKVASDPAAALKPKPEEDIIS